MNTQPRLRYLEAVRRAKIARIAAIGAIVVIPAACSNGDASVFSDVTVVTTPEAAADTTLAPQTTPAPQTTAAPETTTAQASTAVQATEMVVDFTYAASGGRARNPYIAVWVEDTQGNLVDTISLWMLQSQKGTRWMRDLSSWYSASGGNATTSGATRSAGSYSVIWDGTDSNGQPVTPGEYVLFVESAREHGPHSITSAPFSVGASGFSISLPDAGELSGLSATLNA